MESATTKGYPGGFPFLFTYNHQRQELQKRPNQPRQYTTSIYARSSRSYRNKEKLARGRSRCVPRRAILIPLIRLAWHPFSPLYPLKPIFIMGQNISKLSNTHNQTRNQPFHLRTQPCQHVTSTSNNTMSSIYPNMEELPLNVMVDILSRLPVKTIIHCKCVCKKWQFLVSESYFVKLHLSRSPVSLIIHEFTVQEIHNNNGLGILKLVEIEDEADHHRLFHDPIMNFDLNRGLFSKGVKRFRKLPVGSINGLVCLTESGNRSDNTYICNPVTREYMMLPKHIFFAERDEDVVFGFGVGLVTGQYKVIRTFLMHFRENPNPKISRPDLIEAEVYTLGTGKWRRLGRVPYWLDGRQAPLINGPYLNGHVHWIVRDENCPEKICAFNFDDETFKLFPSPPFDATKEHLINLRSMGVLNGCLSQCDISYNDVTIWVMREYGIKKSWYKMVNVRQYMCPKLLMFQPIALLQGLKDGGVLMVHNQEKLYAYYPRTNTIEDIRMFNGHFTGITYRPSFVKLRDFQVESGRVRLLKV